MIYCTPPITPSPFQRQTTVALPFQVEIYPISLLSQPSIKPFFGPIPLRSASSYSSTTLQAAIAIRVKLL